jgi:hypothetical protein
MSEEVGAPALAPVTERTPVDGPCQRCGATVLERYPVLSEGGWFQVVKCQQCLHSVSREPWDLLGPVKLASAGLSLD